MKFAARRPIGPCAVRAAKLERHERTEMIPTRIKLRGPATVALALLVCVICAGTIGFHAIEGWSWFQSFYGTLMTISTIGSKPEDLLSHRGQIFNVALMFAGLIVVGFLVGSVTAVVIQFELSSFFGRRRMEKEIAKLKGHYIICGVGRVGRRIASEIAARGLPLVIIETEPARAQWARDRNFPVIVGDASNEAVLRQAHIDTARGLASAVTSDAQNVYIALTARSLAPDLPIVARASEEDAESKLIKAGATAVVSPYAFAGQRIARTLMRPRVQRFIDTAFSPLAEGGLDLQVEELRVPEKSPLANQTLGTVDAGRRFGVIILGIRRQSGRIEFNPGLEGAAAPGDSLIAIGEAQELKKLETFLGAD
jgi:voltage-gated potassium channel